MLSRLSAWWYGPSAAPATPAVTLAALGLAYRNQHPSLSASSADIVKALAEGVVLAAGSRPMVTDSSDELGVFERSSNDEVAKFRASQAVWRQNLIALLGSEELVDQPVAAVTLDAKPHNSVLQELLDGIKEDVLTFVQTPSEKIRLLMDKIKPHFEQQRTHAHGLIQRLHAEKDLAIQKQIKIEICYIDIEMLEQFIAFINDVNAKISSSLMIDILGEKIALSLLGTTLLILAQITFPQIDMEQTTRDYMGRSIRDNANELDKLLTDLEGELAKNLRHVAPEAVDTLPVDDVPAADTQPGAAAAPTTESLVNASALGMFAAASVEMRAALRTSNDKMASDSDIMKPAI